MKLAGILLAAGQSRRMGKQNKLLVNISGKPIVRYVADSMLSSGISELVVVLGYEAEKVALALSGVQIRTVINMTYKDGQASSVVAGITALNKDVTDVLISLGDMPFVQPDTIRSLIESHFDTDDHQELVTIPNYRGVNGNPTIWGKSFFSDLAALRGDCGGRQALKLEPASINLVSVNTRSILADIDTPTDYCHFNINWTS